MVVESFNYMLEALVILSGINLDQGKFFVYGVVAIFIVSWLTINGYLLCHNPKMLVKWNSQYLSLIAITSLFGFSSFFVSFMFTSFISLFAKLSDKSFKDASFPIILLFMVVYLVLALYTIQNNKKTKNFAIFPGNFTKVVPVSLGLSGGLLFLNLGLYILHDALGTGLFKVVSSVNPLRKYVVAICFFLMGIAFILMFLNPKKFSKIEEHITKFFKRHFKRGIQKVYKSLMGEG